MTKKVIFHWTKKVLLLLFFFLKISGHFKFSIINNLMADYSEYKWIPPPPPSFTTQNILVFKHQLTISLKRFFFWGGGGGGGGGGEIKKNEMVRLPHQTSDYKQGIPILHGPVG